MKFKLKNRYLIFSRMDKHHIFEGKVLEISPSGEMIKFQLDSKSSVWYNKDEVNVYEELKTKLSEAKD